ncbi:hypothetical protein AWC38_SpisGene12801 [Stylophora pistillata]|uniref:Mab-21-like HhH/H2TH-like domain-containing protein n=1 Tax=Stylophora pistillata TaxID=50429 RepID=A0A2B4RW53_STYPI|nr:hypothetical protein AWC38_SpisGene12801 [Stylophora pistillata]
MKGKDNVVADALSRVSPQPIPREGEDEEDFIPEHMLTEEIPADSTRVGDFRHATAEGTISGLLIIPSRSELLNGRKYRALLPTKSPIQNPHYQVVREQMVKDKNKVCEHYNKTARDLPSLPQNQRVYVQVHPQYNQWTPATVTKTPVASQPRSYSVETTKGAQLVRNRRFIRPAQEITPVPADSMKRGDNSSSERPRRRVCGNLNMNLDELTQSKSEGDEDDSVPIEGSRPIDKDKANSSLTPLDLFLQDLDRNIAKIPRCQEVIDIQMGVENLLKDLLLELEQENPFFKTTLINCGSFYEDTKVEKPDEFDYLVQLDYFSEPTDIQYEELPDASVIVIPSKSSFKKIQNLSTYKWIPKEISDFDWKTHVKAPFSEILYEKGNDYEGYGLRVIENSTRHGPAYSLKLEWIGGERYHGLKIGVDLSLAVKINFPSSTMDLKHCAGIPADVMQKTISDSVPYFFAVSDYKEYKCPPSNLLKNQMGDSYYCECYFRLRCSQSCLEQALFQHFGPEGRPTVCLRVLKVLRDYSTIVNLGPFFSEKLDVHTNLSRTEKNDDVKTECNSWFSSYALKTLVLHEWSQYPDEKYWLGSCMSDHVFQILDRLLLSVKGGSIRSFFYADYNVLPGGEKKEMSREQADAINSITILHHWMTSKTNDIEYNFNDCLQSITDASRLVSHKITFTKLSNQTLNVNFKQDLEQVVIKATGKEPLDRNKTRRTSEPRVRNTHWYRFARDQIFFCRIYIQALVDKVAPMENLILLDPISHSSDDEDLTRALDFFEEIAKTRMNSLGNNLPSYNIWTKEFKPGDQEIANFVEFLTDIFRKDLQILLSKL